MKGFESIRRLQLKVMEILTSEEYKESKLTKEKQNQLDVLIYYSGNYEKNPEIQELNDNDLKHYWNMQNYIKLLQKRRIADV